MKRLGMVIPLFKLGSLTIRTISKPIASRLKKDAGLHPGFREFIINIAQANHRFTTTIQRRIHGHVSDVVIRSLNEDRAVQLAADLLGEAFLFSVAGLAVIYEVQRNSRSETKKEEKRKQELEVLKQRDAANLKEIEALKVRLNDLEQILKPKSFHSHDGFLDDSRVVGRLLRHTGQVIWSYWLIMKKNITFDN